MSRRNASVEGSRAGRQVPRDLPPLATGTQHIRETVDELSNIDIPISSAVFGWPELGVQYAAISVGQITLVAKLVPVLPAGLGVHMRRLVNWFRAQNAQSIRAGQPPSQNRLCNDSRTSETDNDGSIPTLN